MSGDPDEAAAELRALARDAKVALGAALDLFESRTGFLAARGVDVARIRFSTGFGRGLDYYTGFVFELYDPGARAPGSWSPAAATTACSRARRACADPGGRLRGLDRAARRREGPIMSAPFVIAVPAKGRLQENAEAFFARAGLQLVKPRGAATIAAPSPTCPGSRSPSSPPPRSRSCWRRAPCISGSPARTSFVR